MGSMKLLNFNGPAYIKNYRVGSHYVNQLLKSEVFISNRI